MIIHFVSLNDKFLCSCLVDFNRYHFDGSVNFSIRTFAHLVDIICVCLYVRVCVYVRVLELFVYLFDNLVLLASKSAFNTLSVYFWCVA